MKQNPFFDNKFFEHIKPPFELTETSKLRSFNNRIFLTDENHPPFEYDWIHEEWVELKLGIPGEFL